MSIRKQYDTDLESLKNSLTEMGRNSADAVENALEALCVADADAAAAIVKGDARINNMERDIEHRCMTLLLRQQPVAGWASWWKWAPRRRSSAHRRINAPRTTFPVGSVKGGNSYEYP